MLGSLNVRHDFILGQAGDLVEHAGAKNIGEEPILPGRAGELILGAVVENGRVGSKEVISVDS